MEENYQPVDLEEEQQVQPRQQEDLWQAVQQEAEQEEHPNKLPSRGKYIKFKRQEENQIEQDQYIPTNMWTLAKITAKLKPDRFGRTYFNILYIDGSEDGIFLTLPPLKSNDFPWHHILREQFDHAAARLEQLDGTAITPDSLTPQSSLKK